MNTFINYFIRNYNAVLVSQDYCEEYMDEGDTVTAVLAFPDKKKSFGLMGKYDFEAFPPKERAILTERKEAPFELPLLIFYKDNKGESSYKLVNGMLSKIFEILDSLPE